MCCCGVWLFKGCRSVQSCQVTGCFHSVSVAWSLWGMVASYVSAGMQSSKWPYHSLHRRSVCFRPEPCLSLAFFRPATIMIHQEFMKGHSYLCSSSQNLDSQSLLTCWLHKSWQPPVSPPTIRTPPTTYSYSLCHQSFPLLFFCLLLVVFSNFFHLSGTTNWHVGLSI